VLPVTELLALAKFLGLATLLLFPSSDSYGGQGESETRLGDTTGDTTGDANPARCHML